MKNRKRKILDDLEKSGKIKHDDYVNELKKLGEKVAEKEKKNRIKLKEFSVRNPEIIIYQPS